MQINPISALERVGKGGASHVAEVTHEDLTTETAATAQVIDLGAIPVKSSVKLIQTELVEAFEDEDDADNNSLLVKLGDGSNDARFQANTQMNVHDTEVFLSHGTGTQQAFTAADTLKATFTPGAGKNVAALNKGKVRFYFLLSDARVK